MKGSENPYQVSIIIPAFNEEKHLKKCLTAISEMNFQRDLLEIILVDNGSCDTTVQIAEKFGIRVMSKTDGTIASVRNYGAKNAQGEILGFIDADCQVSKDWLKSAVPHFDHPEVGAVGSRLSHQESTWVARCWSIIHSRKIEIGETEWLPSGNMLVSRRAFNEVRGFDEQLVTSEDVDLCLRVRDKGYKILSDPKISSIHLNPPKTMLEFYRKEKWHGQEMLKMFFKKNQKVSRAFLYAVFFLCCIFGILVGAAISILFHNYFFILIPVSMFILAPLFLAVQTARKSNCYRYLFPLWLIFMVYGIARSVSVFGKGILLKSSSCQQQ
jgi:cellulose synthase/poly-beta-1,6-N-acetylglucosamine synthase-like glycosyltransferase